MPSNSCHGNKRSSLRGRWILAASWASSLLITITYSSTRPRPSPILNTMVYSSTKEALEASQAPPSNPSWTTTWLCSTREETRAWWWCKALCLHSPTRITRCSTSTNSSKTSLNSPFEACIRASLTTPTCPSQVKGRWWIAHNTTPSSMRLRTTSEVAHLIPSGSTTTITSIWSNLLGVRGAVPTLPISCKWCSSSLNPRPTRVASALSMGWRAVDRRWCHRQDASSSLEWILSNRNSLCLPISPPSTLTSVSQQQANFC